MFTNQVRCTETLLIVGLQHLRWSCDHLRCPQLCWPKVLQIKDLHGRWLLQSGALQHQGLSKPDTLVSRFCFTLGVQNLAKNISKAMLCFAYKALLSFAYKLEICKQNQDRCLPLVVLHNKGVQNLAKRSFSFASLLTFGVQWSIIALLWCIVLLTNQRFVSKTNCLMHLWCCFAFAKPRQRFVNESKLTVSKS